MAAAESGAAPASEPPAVEARDLVKSFALGATTLQVIAGVSLALRAGETAAITGPSGSGKSTLLHMLGTLERPTGGELRIAGADPFALSERALARLRNERIGFVFQDHHLLPQYTVLENVLLPALAFGRVDAARELRGRELLVPRRPGGARRAPSGRALGRRASAGGHRARAGAFAAAAAVRRAHRPARCQERRGDRRPAARAARRSCVGGGALGRGGARGGDPQRRGRRAARPPLRAGGRAVLRSLSYYRRAHLALALAVAVATAVLAGALVVGDSVRGSLRELALSRLGGVERVVVAERAFRDRLAADWSREGGGTTAAALVARASARHGESGSRASGVTVLGVDAAWESLFPDAPLSFARREGQQFPSVLLADALARELGAEVGDNVDLLLPAYSAIPRETLVGRQEAHETVATLRLTVAGLLPEGGLGGFRLDTRQAAPLNAVVERSRLARAIGARDRANLLVARGAADAGTTETSSRANACGGGARARRHARRPRSEALDPWRRGDRRERAAAARRCARRAARSIGARSGSGGDDGVHLPRQPHAGRRSRSSLLDGDGAGSAFPGRGRGRGRWPRRRAPHRRRRTDASARARRDRAQRVGGGRARRRARCAGRARVLRRRSARRARRALGDVPRRLGGGDARSRRRPQPDARAAGALGRGADGRLGPALPGRPLAHPPGGRGVLAAPSRRTEGLRRARRRAAALAQPLRRRLVAALDAAGGHECRDARAHAGDDRAASDRPRGRRPRAARGARGGARGGRGRHRLRRTLPRLQLLPARRGAAPGGAARGAGDRGAGPRGGPPRRPRLPGASCAPAPPRRGRSGVGARRAGRASPARSASLR